MERLAVMGGTFDPIHRGHLRMAAAVQKQLGFDRVVFLPSFNPPHKQIRCDFASWQDRLEMVRLGIKDYPGFTVSTLEFDRGGLSYTYDTVCSLQELWPDAEIFLIIGEDSLDQLHTWHRIRDLLRVSRFVVVQRPGYQGEKGEERLIQACGIWVKGHIIHAAVPETALSSTEIRQRVKKGRPIRDMVPFAVEEYIAAHQLYRQEVCEEEREKEKESGTENSGQ